jgi:hypothetical protein
MADTVPESEGLRFGGQHVIVTLRQNSVGTGSVKADAILPKGHVKTASTRLTSKSVAGLASSVATEKGGEELHSTP